MKQRKYKSKEELIKKIKEKRELSGISDKVVKEELEKYIKKYGISAQEFPKKQAKVIVKSIRTELRKLVGRFNLSKKDKLKLLEKNSLMKLLKSHSSTAERLDFYPELIKFLKNLKIKSLLDLGCGLNPIALSSHLPNLRYYASDVNEFELSLIETFFRKNNIHGKAFFYDLRKIKNDLPRADLCLIFKVLDVIAEKKHRSELAESIIRNIKCKSFLVSFSTKKLSGRRMNSPKRIWFESLLYKLNLKFDKFSSENEVFYFFKMK